jgi:mono/diheme cytochrome c family protein
VKLLILGMCGFLGLMAQDGPALYKSKCAGCHGPKGVGRPAMKGSSLTSPEAKKATDQAMQDEILNGGAAKKAAHAYGQKGVTPEQAKALVAYIRELQK